MNVKYFSDTDTLHMILSSETPSETKEINENIMIDMAADGRVLSVTIEHARNSASLPEFSYQVVNSEDKKAA
jgi:uncharacterized protein YuzE